MNKAIEKFNLPIQFINKQKNTSKNIKDDLEIINSKTELNSVYNELFNPQTEYGKQMLINISNNYTTDKAYLKETQKLYEVYKPNLNNEIFTDFDNKLKHLKENKNFLKDFQYLDIKQLHFLNKNEMFLQLFSLYNIGSPAFSLFYPLIIFLVPFVLLRIKRNDLPFSVYKKILFDQLKKSSFGKLHVIFNNEVEVFKKIYIFITFGLYVFGIYQNIKSCIKFVKNIKEIQQTFTQCKIYLEYILNEINKLLKCCKNLKTYSMFANSFKTHIENIKNLSENISNLGKISIKKPTSIGSALLILHSIRYNDDLNDSFNFTFGFIGYIDTYLGLQKNIKENKINKVIFTKKNTEFKKFYHPLITSNKIIYNDVKLDNNIVLSGENASGKTTLIKSICLNILLCQQIGYGYFSSGKLNPYHTINSYLNISDNNDKDSLFQLEAKKCKEILDEIKLNKKHRHFCIFDELYSGTNPEDAVEAAYKYLKYIGTLNSNYIITTHYKNLCKKMEDCEKVVNKKMESHIFIDGICQSKNGLNILKELNYPKELLNN